MMGTDKKARCFRLVYDYGEFIAISPSPWAHVSQSDPSKNEPGALAHSSLDIERHSTAHIVNLEWVPASNYP